MVAQHDGLYISHMRSEGTRLLESLDELTGLADSTGVRAEVYHLKAAGQDNWPKMRAALDRIEQARARGLQVTADIYPYTAGMTSLSACIPPRYHDGGTAALLERLADPGTRADIARDIVVDSGTWENLYLAAGGASGILLLGGLEAADAPHLGAHAGPGRGYGGQGPGRAAAGPRGRRTAAPGGLLHHRRGQHAGGPVPAVGGDLLRFRGPGQRGHGSWTPPRTRGLTAASPACSGVTPATSGCCRCLRRCGG